MDTSRESNQAVRSEGASFVNWPWPLKRFRIRLVMATDGAIDRSKSRQGWELGAVRGLVGGRVSPSSECLEWAVECRTGPRTAAARRFLRSGGAHVALLVVLTAEQQQTGRNRKGGVTGRVVGWDEVGWDVW